MALLLGLFTVACNTEQGRDTPTEDPTEKEKPVSSDWTYLDQGWNETERDSFWFTSQGARIMPYAWFTALETPSDTLQLFTPRHLEDLGYLPVPESASNPGGLPIGFALDKDQATGEGFVGFTCAACHTNVIDYAGKSFLIDGAPTLSDFVGFYDEVVLGLQATRDNAAKFERFAHTVLADKYDEAAVAELKAALNELTEAAALRQKAAALPDHYPTDFTSYGRLDAFTNIENAGSVFALNLPDNGNPAIAPVSYPFLWGTHQSDVVQWNGSASNIPRSIGPLIRNTGEVVGVFGGLKISDPKGKRIVPQLPLNYTSTADFAGLEALENFVKTLESPRWDDPNSNLPAVDPQLVAAGAVHFKKYCQGCHQLIPSDRQDSLYKAKMVPLATIKTDPVTAMAALTNMAATGILQGMKVEILDGPVMQDTMPAITIPVNGVAGLLAPVILAKLKAGKEGEDKHAEINMQGHSRGGSHAQEGESSGDAAPDPSYKARPLNGIWATAPYLHNGSVPNLWEMLKKPEERVQEFWVGSRELDPKNVGFVTDKGKNLFKVTLNGEIMPGNSNLGHDFGTEQLTDTEKWELIEFLKTL